MSIINQTATFELGTEDQNLYQVYDKREILRLLQGIVEEGGFVALSLQNSEGSFLSRLLKVDSKNKRVLLDAAQDEAVNNLFIASNNIMAEASLNKVRILFNISNLSSCHDDGFPALCFSIPENMIRLQRREFFRVNTPVVQTAECIIPIFSEPYVLKLADISCGGIAILDEMKYLSTKLGHEYTNCQIDLGDTGNILTTLQIRNFLDLTLPNGRIKRRFGCQFQKLAPGMLATIQRYIMALERERNARLTGMF